MGKSLGWFLETHFEAAMSLHSQDNKPARTDLIPLASPFWDAVRAAALGRPSRNLVRRQRGRQELADRLLVIAILGVLPTTDGLCEHRRALEEKSEGAGANAGPVQEGTGGVAAPLVENEPDELFRSEVGVAAVSPKPRGDEAAVKVGLVEVARELRVNQVVVLGCLVYCISCQPSCRWGGGGIAG